MNYQRLNELAAKAMGWKLYLSPKHKDPYWETENGLDGRRAEVWNPSTCADDALMLINKAVERWGYWSLDKCSGCYEAVTQGGNREFTGEAETPALALTLCALRAAGIPESEITAAME